MVLSIRSIAVLLITAHRCDGFLVGSNEALTTTRNSQRNVVSARPNDGGRFVPRRQHLPAYHTELNPRFVHSSGSSLWAASQAFLAPHNALPLMYMMLLALQFAVQPILTQRFAPKTLIRSTYILVQDLSRVFIAAMLLTTTGSWTSALKNWSWQTSLITAGLPSLFYLVQNFCSLIAYQHLPPITYNVLNQTKTLSAAFWCFLLLQQKQSLPQIISLGILLLSALVMEDVVQLPFWAPTRESAMTKPSQCDQADLEVDRNITSAGDNCLILHAERRTYIFTGVLPVLAASLISGLAGAWVQRALQVVEGGSNSLFLTLQMSAFSSVFLTASMLTISPDRQRATDTGSWKTGWTIYTWIPIIVNSLGGVLVGLVTKFSGAVAKGFALIAGMFLSGILQNYFSAGTVTAGKKRVSAQQWIGGSLAALSVYLHSAYPALH